MGKRGKRRFVVRRNKWAMWNIVDTHTGEHISFDTWARKNARIMAAALNKAYEEKK